MKEIAAYVGIRYHGEYVVLFKRAFLLKLSDVTLAIASVGVLLCIALIFYKAIRTKKDAETRGVSSDGSLTKVVHTAVVLIAGLSTLIGVWAEALLSEANMLSPIRLGTSHILVFVLSLLLIFIPDYLTPEQ